MLRCSAGLVLMLTMACAGSGTDGSDGGGTSSGDSSTSAAGSSTDTSTDSGTAGGCEAQAMQCEADLEPTSDCFENSACGMKPQCQYAICQADCVEAFMQGVDECWRDCDPAVADEAACTGACAATWHACASMDPCDFVELDKCTAAYSTCGQTCSG